MLISLISLLTVLPTSYALENNKNQSKLNECLQLYQSLETLTGVPWEFLAAMDQYERNIINKDKELVKGRVTAIQIPNELWSGIANPYINGSTPQTIQLFQGIGRDGNQDGVADPNNDQDVLYSVATFLGKKGTDEDQIREQLWSYYHQPNAVDVITHIARLYQKHQTLDLFANSFPIPLRYNYTYKGTWGDRRGWGGLRIHEGTDIFANYGTPVLSTCYGYVELIGWNVFGGWRIGIRDVQNRYHYFAHLNHFKKGLKSGDLVTPGEVIGTVGSSGYGPPGTSGKFPPHLHYGIYKFDGKKTYSFDPFPLLKKWELETKKKQNGQKKSLKK